jgi:hypothetical protein
MGRTGKISSDMHLLLITARLTRSTFQTFSTMKPPTDYIRHAARLARKLQMDSALGGTPQPDAEFFKTLSKAFDEIAAGLELVARPD